MQLRDARFLVVDDHQPMREILKSLLYGLGARQVQEARDAAEAFDILRYTVFDILLTDYDMEGATGVQLARRLRRTEGNANRRIPIIMVTGRAEGPVIIQARDAGVDEYLVKPLTTVGLCQKIEAVLARRRPFIDSTAYVGPDRRRRAAEFAGPERRQAAMAGARRS
ncbi:response regulator [Phenylobacterium soli]|uniref:Response regulator n=1 Tax=Phenylobacterium soli TaxID=2170551 RepID=A0A328APU0_9CAUL|nr:response regulator [Phenylobacterium soli]RAK54878.1 response regulator [Phenylobacterium soli]